MGVLKELFELYKNGPDNSPSPEDQKRLDGLLGFVEKASPFGKKIIDEALAKGVKIDFEYDPEDRRVGAFLPGHNMIVLNGLRKDAELASCLVHEARHVAQTLSYEAGQNLKSAIVVDRAIEADAVAHQCVSVFDMKNADYEVYRVFKDKFPAVVKGYADEMRKSGDIEKAMGEAFKGWYDRREYVDNYDCKTVDYMALVSGGRNAFKKEVTGKELSETFCLSNGKPYVPASFFSTQRALVIKEETAKRAEKVEKSPWRYLFSKPKTTSVDSMYILESNGKIRQPKNTAVMMAAQTLVQSRR